jgi:hypothetical protein
VLGTEGARKMEEFNDNLKRLDAASKGARISIGNDLIPIFNQFIEQIIKVKRYSAASSQRSITSACRLIRSNRSAKTSGNWPAYR